MNKLLMCFGFLLISSNSFAQQTIENFLGMRFVEIPPGEFVMGTADIETAVMEVPEAKPNELKDETPAHKVRITKPFYIGRTEVTQQQWFKVMENKPGPDEVWQRKDWKQLPVASVSWFMADRFVAEINKMDKTYRYRLPTEAEWEYVAKSGNNDLRPVPLEDLEDYAWFINNSGDIPQKVATKKANSFGVYDMMGNVWEWVNDWYGPDTYSASNRVNPQGPKTGRSKVRRGGSYHCPLHLTRPGYRSANEPGVRYDVLGLRLVLEKRQ